MFARFVFAAALTAILVVPTAYVGAVATTTATTTSAATTTTTSTPAPASKKKASLFDSSFFRRFQSTVTNALERFLQKKIDQVFPNTQPPAQAGGSPSAGGSGSGTGGVGVSAVPGGIPFGGAITEIVLCTAPPGMIHVTIGPPTPMMLCCQTPEICRSYLYGPPSYPSQWLLGTNIGPGACMVGTVELPCMMIGATPGHGSSGPIPPTPPPKLKKSSPPSQCGTNESGFSSAVDKRAAEQTLRDTLSAKGISVNRASGCGLNQTFQQYIAAHCPTTKTCGCTDVSGLSCSTVDYLDRLKNICGNFTISGGSESGHATHGGGGALDVVGIDDCIKKNFTPYGNSGCRYIDTVTGTTFYDEGSCSSTFNTGPHFHICVPGHGC